jgi:hypothetical protein
MWTVAVVIVSAAAVWDAKPFTQWSDKDVDKLLTDSPWAGKASITHAREGANLGTVPDWKLIVTVQSALPIKEAIVRRSLGSGVTPSPELEAQMSAASPRYVLAISNIPRLYERQLLKSAQAAALHPKGKSPIAATDASIILLDKDGNRVESQAPRPQASSGVQIVTVAQRGGGGGGGFGGRGGSDGGGFGAGVPEDKSGITATLIVEFPKTSPLTVEDQEVEVSTVIGAYSVKKSFKLKEMMFMGALAF